MSKQDVIEALSQDVSDELAAIMQYLWHHYTAEGVESPAIIELFETTSRDEMKHLEMLAERIVYLGGEPPTTISQIRKGGDLRKMMQDDLDAENHAIRQYKEHIALSASENDPVTRLMLERILSDEERHADLWQTTLGTRK
ncbi:MAG: ferritin-like domain-containing protein [Chloroflexi bacterium]|nr:ferritin-like domain-containing protein [Chloroflexota bacterium]